MLGMSHAISVARAMTPGVNEGHDSYGLSATPATATWQRRAVPALMQPQPYDSLEFFLIERWSAALSKGVLSASPEFWALLDAIEQPSEGNALLSFIGGNEHSVLSMVEHTVPFDFMLPEEPACTLIEGRQPIDVQVIETLLTARMGTTTAMLTALRYKHPRMRLLHVMPPPPITSEAQIRSRPEIFETAFKSFGITPISVRLKVYRVYCRLLGTVLQSLNIEALPAPAAALDEFGGLRAEFAFGCTHGNEAYGAMVAAQIAAALRA